MIINETNKFKTVIVSVRFKEQIKQNRLGVRSLLPQVMSASTPLYKTRKSLNAALENLYGAQISARTYRLGDLSIIEFSLYLINPSLMAEGYFEEGLQIFHNLIYGHKNLPKKDFHLEKRLLLEQIDSLENNKTAFALTNLFSLMFKDEKYSLKTIGEAEDIKNITYQELNSYYQEVITNNDCDVLISGDFNANAKSLVNKYFQSKNKYNYHPVDKEIHPLKKEVKQVEEFSSVSQTKLNIGYNFPVQYGHNNYNAAVLFNIAFGGAPHSRLFLTVREKHSLCYYISANFDPYKGFIYVYAGIDKDKVALALKLISEELNYLQTNLLSEKELDLSKKYLLNNLKEVEDNQNSWISNIYQKTLLSDYSSLQQRIAEINAVTPEAVKDAANLLQLDTIYLLNPEVK